MSTTTALEGDRRRGVRTPFRRVRRAAERVRLLGGDMDLMRPEEVLLEVERRVAMGAGGIIANHNLHSLHLLRRTPGLQRFYDLASLIQVDSTPILWFARLLGLPARQTHRSTYLDWRGHFWALADRRGWRVMYLGGAPGVAERAAASLRIRHPNVTIAARHGHFDVAGDENRAALAEIEAFAPDILLVGMGMPRQELWIADNHSALGAAVVFSVGAAFDYEAGVQAAAPRWMGRFGVEWLYRLARDPARLFVRYCVEPWSLIGPALDDLRRSRVDRRRPVALQANDA